MRLPTLLTLALVASPCLAQTQLVRGDVDRQQQTNLFFLDCTGIQLVSSTVNLALLHNQSQQQNIEFEMQVVDVSGNGTVLNVVSALTIPEMFDMGNLRFGRSERWEVFGAPGALTAVYATATATTRYLPYGAAGTWLIGAPSLLVNQGTLNALGQFEFSVQMPSIPALIGQDFTAQAFMVEPSLRLVIANPDCKTVEAS